MSGVNELGEALSGIFGPQVEGFFGTTQAAQEQLRHIQEDLHAVTVGADNAPLREAFGGLEAIGLALDGIAAQIAVARESGRNFMALLGLEADFGTTTQTTESAPLNPHNMLREAARRDAPLPLRVNSGLSLLSYDVNNRILDRAIASSRDSGIRTVRDLLVIGEARLKAVPNLGPKGRDEIKARLKRICPEAPLSRNPDPSIAARFCESLDDVPMWVIHESDYLHLRPDVEGVSVQDILTRPIEDFFCGSAFDSKAPPRDWHIEHYAKLRERAQNYANQFNEAKRSAK
jgi:hypothetical protein